jgi:hypothetical protein
MLDCLAQRDLAGVENLLRQVDVKGLKALKQQQEDVVMEEAGGANAGGTQPTGGPQGGVAGGASPGCTPSKLMPQAAGPGAAAAASGGGATSSGGTGRVGPVLGTTGYRSTTPASSSGLRQTSSNQQGVAAAGLGLQQGAAAMVSPQQQQQMQAQAQAHYERVCVCVEGVHQMSLRLGHLETLQLIPALRDGLAQRDLAGVEHLLCQVDVKHLQAMGEQQQAQALHAQQQGDVVIQEQGDGNAEAPAKLHQTGEPKVGMAAAEAGAALGADRQTPYAGAEGGVLLQGVPAAGAQEATRGLGAGTGNPSTQQQVKLRVTDFPQLFQHLVGLRMAAAAGPAAVQQAAAGRPYHLRPGAAAARNYLSDLLGVADTPQAGRGCSSTLRCAAGQQQQPSSEDEGAAEEDAAVLDLGWDMQVGLLAGYVGGKRRDITVQQLPLFFHEYQKTLLEALLAARSHNTDEIHAARELADERHNCMHMVGLGAYLNLMLHRGWQKVLAMPEMQPFVQRMATAAALVKGHWRDLAQTEPSPGDQGCPKPGDTLNFRVAQIGLVRDEVEVPRRAPTLCLLLLSLLGVGGYGRVWLFKPLDTAAWCKAMGLPAGAELPGQLAVKLPVTSQQAREGVNAKECTDWCVRRAGFEAAFNKEASAMQRLATLPSVADLVMVGRVELFVAPTAAAGEAPEWLWLPMLVMPASLGSMYDLQHHCGPLRRAPAVFPDRRMPEPLVRFFLLVALVIKAGMAVFGEVQPTGIGRAVTCSLTGSTCRG